MINRFYRNINGVPDPHEYQETILGQEISQDDSLHLYLSVASVTRNPAAWFRQGFTAFSQMGNIESQYKQWMYLYNHKNNKVTIGYDWGSFPFGDYHSSASVLILRDGRILTITSSQHNDSLTVKRSINPYNITSYEDIAEIVEEIAYPNLTLLGDRIYMVVRSFPLIENAVSYSDDFGETWSAFKPILNSGAYANYWMYPKSVFGQTKIMHFVTRRDMVTTNLFDKIYYLESEDGVNWRNVDGSYSRDIDVLKLSASDLETYYKVRDINPAKSMVHAACQFNCKPFYVIETPDTDGALDFGYHNGSIWQTKTIEIVGIKLRDANRMELIPTALDSFILYCCEYDAFLSPVPSTPARIVKITTTDNFDTYSHEFITTDEALNYSVVAGQNFNEFGKTAVIAGVPKVYGSGPDTDPLNSYANFKIVDVL